MYIPTKIKLSRDDQAKLLSGGGVRIHANHCCGSGLTTHLTSKQVKAIKGALKRGHLLKFTPAQLRRNIKHGAGYKEVWSSFKRGVSKAASKVKSIAKKSVPYLKKGAELAYEHGVPKALDAIADAVDDPSLKAIVKGVKGAIPKTISLGRGRKNKGGSFRLTGNGKPKMFNDASQNTGAFRTSIGPMLYNEPSKNVAGFRDISGKRINPQMFNDQVNNVAGNRQNGNGWSPLGLLGQTLGVPDIGFGKRRGKGVPEGALIKDPRLWRPEGRPLVRSSKVGTGIASDFVSSMGLGKKKKRGKGIIGDFASSIGLGKKKSGKGYFGDVWNRAKGAPSKIISVAQNPASAYKTVTPIGAIIDKVPYGDQIYDIGAKVVSKALMPGSGRKRRTLKGKSFRN